MNKINTINFLISHYSISLVKTASSENKSTYTVSRSVISIKLKTLTYSENGPSQVSHVRMKTKEGGKKTTE